MTATTSVTITAASFPTPDLVVRSIDPAELDRVAAFATHQAEIANTLYRGLPADWPGTRWAHRVTALRGAHAEATAWRHRMALNAPARVGIGLPLDAQQFITPLREGGANYDRIGHIGRLRAGSTWDPTTRTYLGGATTPAYEVMAHYGQAATARFDREAPGENVLDNPVTVGASGRTIIGNRLVRGAAARVVADALLARTAARGRDTSRMEVGGELMYAVTAQPDATDTMFNVALSMLAGAADLAGLARLRAWQDARYLLYQAPRMKKGSDAVTRVFLVATAAVLFGRAPVLLHDVDLRCMVLGQAAATEMPGDTALIAG